MQALYFRCEYVHQRNNTREDALRGPGRNSDTGHTKATIEQQLNNQPAQRMPDKYRRRRIGCNLLRIEIDETLHERRTGIGMQDLLPSNVVNRWYRQHGANVTAGREVARELVPYRRQQPISLYETDLVIYGRQSATRRVHEMVFDYQLYLRLLKAPRS